MQVMLPEGNINCRQRTIRARATIVLLYRILTIATELKAMTSLEGNIVTYEDNIARQPDIRVLPCS